MFTIPNKGQSNNDVQSILFQDDIDILMAGINGLDCVLSGCAVTAQGSPNMTVAVAKGATLANGILRAIATGNVTIGAAHATLPRIDTVVADASGVKQCRAGTASATPQPPARTANDVALAFIYVAAAVTSIGPTVITDKRVMRTQGPITIAKVTGAVTFNTTAAAQTYLTVTIPNGLFLAGRTLRVRAGGNYLSNSGTPTWTLTILYGGSTIFSDVTAATAADTDRGAWRVEFDLIAQANADQALTGRVHFQSPGTKGAPTTGQAGDLATVADVNSPIAAGLAIDSDAADRVLTLQWTMSVSNVAVETVMEGATVELV